MRRPGIDERWSTDWYGFIRHNSYCDCDRMNSKFDIKQLLVPNGPAGSPCVAQLLPILLLVKGQSSSLIAAGPHCRYSFPTSSVPPTHNPNSPHPPA